MPRIIRVFAPATLVAVAVIATLYGLKLGGAGDVRELLDPGALIRYGGPIARLFVNLSSGVLVGSLLLAVWALNGSGKEQRTVLDLAAGAAALLTVSSLVTLVFSFVDMANVELSLENQFGAALAQFVSEVALGQLWILMAALAGIITVLAFATSDRRWVLFLFMLSIVTLFPLALQGHAQGASGHDQAVNSLFLHLAGAAAWIGGLITVVFVSRVVTKERLSVITGRYSSIALLAFITVAASGVVSALLRVGTVADLFGTGYGQLVILKAVTLVALGIFGAIHRERLIPKIADTKTGAKVFGWFVVAEFFVMGAASGVAAALGRTRTPVPIEPAWTSGGKISPAEYLTGDPLPPPYTLETAVTVWKFDLLWTMVSVFGIMFYLLGVVRLMKRGDKWPVGRTAMWILGLVLLFLTTNGSFNAYERYVFSVHMLGHMMLTMLIPLILVLGAPVTLLLRATERRKDDSWGGREWVMWAIHTPYSKVITHPIVAAAIFAGSLWVFYFTPVLKWAMSQHLGHQWMILHFLISGYLFSMTMIGIDPIPKRFPHPLRIVILFATMTSHAFFGVTIMSMNTMLAPEWFGAMGRTWGWPPLEDQSAGGSIAWAIGELPTLLLALTVGWQWMRDDRKQQTRLDRAADRSDEAELRAYNEMLAKQARRDKALENQD